MKFINNSLDLSELNKSFNDPNKPYKYVVIDNFFNKEDCDRFSDSHPTPTDKRWFKFRDKIKGKKNIFEQKMIGIAHPDSLPKECYNIIKELTSQNFVDMLEKITGIEGILNDTYNEIGQWSGVRGMFPGAYQSIHSDARKHPFLGIEKKITLIGYLNKEWKEDDAGYTEVWTNDMSTCYERVNPLYNRVMIFENTEKSYHGVPEVNCYRKTFLTAYLKDTKDFKETRPKAKFVARPEENNPELWDKLSQERAHLTDY